MLGQQTTPKIISSKIESYCFKVAKERPSFVEVRPDSDSVVSQCYMNCARYVRKNPGASIVFGWTIWESSLILELEAHSVVRLLDGTLIDVTPPMEGEKKILFLPDPIAVPRFDFDRSGIGFWVTNFHNIIFPTTTRRSRRVLSRDESRDPAKNAADFAEKYPGLTFGTVENTQVNDAFAWSIDQYVPQTVGPKVGRNEPCPCGSGKKYKKCCCP